MPPLLEEANGLNFQDEHARKKGNNPTVMWTTEMWPDTVVCPFGPNKDLAYGLMKLGYSNIIYNRMLYVVTWSRI